MLGIDGAVLSSAWGVASALAIAVLGGISLAGGRSRPRGALPFGVFAILWSVQILLGSVLRVTADTALAQNLYLLFLASLVPLPYFLVEFAATQPVRATRRWLAARWAIATLGLASALAMLVAPTLLLDGIVQDGGAVYARWGPLYVPLVQAPLFGAFGLALFALWTSARDAPTERTAVRAVTLMAGLALYVAFTASSNLVYYASIPLLYPEFITATTSAFLALFMGLSGLVIALGARAWRSARQETRADAVRRHAWAAAALLVPFAWGLLEGVALILTTWSRFNTVGLWRLAGVGIIVYGLARWRVYDLPQRATRIATRTTGAAAAASIGALGYGAGTVVAGPAVGALAGILVAGGALLPSLRLARRLLAGRSDPRAQPDDVALYGQRIDAYRAALEASLARGSLAEDEAFLLALRERFAIADAEDRVLRYYARSAVIIPRSQNAWDAYDRLRLLGEGGGGRTWLARDRSRDRLVVLKEPLERWHQEPGAREMVLREARMAARVRHANVVAIEEVLEDKGAPVIAMEYLEGGSLADMLRSRGALPSREAIALMVDVLSGVEAIHAAGIVHRDIKPSNVLLTREGVPKIADFGIAVSHSSGKTAVMEVGSSTIAGTVAYMAPEARAGGAADKRSDLYACAMLLHELVVGQPPRGGPTLVHPAVPPAVLGVIAKGLSERPDERYPSARAFAEALVRASG